MLINELGGGYAKPLIAHIDFHCVLSEIEHSDQLCKLATIQEPPVEHLLVHLANDLGLIDGAHQSRPPAIIGCFGNDPLY